MNIYLNSLYRLYQKGKLTIEMVNKSVSLNRISQEEANEIIKELFS